MDLREMPPARAAPGIRAGTLWLLWVPAAQPARAAEVADRLSLKNDLEIARQIQQAMLPRGAFRRLTRGVRHDPAGQHVAATYDILQLPDGKVPLALGDVAGKAARRRCLAPLLAMMRACGRGLPGR